LFKIASEQTTFEESFALSNDVLLHGVQSITDLMVRPGLINLDFADVETVMSSMGKAMMGTGQAEGEGRAVKAAESAINNPLIDDYSLKGAKGLLVNITGGKDLKLFEVDEAVNKVRAEVDPEAELIIGAITDDSLDGLMRVSIVATALDGQQPEPKSVINMVHRIQNRNPGYSEFTNTGSSQSFAFTNSNSSIITNGANALKIDEEVKNDDLSSKNIDSNEANESSSTLVSESLEQTEATIASSINSEFEHNIEDQTSENNGLENFDLSDEDTPELFNSGANEELSTSSEETVLEQDEDLEIPAFLRRQKN
jgi:cell division protein FtsZ